MARVVTRALVRLAEAEASAVTDRRPAAAPGEAHGAGGSSGAAASAGALGSSGSAGSAGKAGAAGNAGAADEASAAGANSDIPGGGTILFQERFDNASLAARGWYDGPGGTISTTEHAPGSASSFECAFAQAATGCTAGKPARHAFTATESVYLAFSIKFSQGWVGSNQAVSPPHVPLFDRSGYGLRGPRTHAPHDVHRNGGERALLALQDSRNVDLACIIRNNDTFVGCNGNVRRVTRSPRIAASAPATASSEISTGAIASITETAPGIAREAGAQTARSRTLPSPRYESDWHRVEVYFQMNTIQGGRGVPDGKIRSVQDGQTLISHDRILMRTATFAAMKFDQFAMLPYIGDGSPIAQRFWVDELVVATARP